MELPRGTLAVLKRKTGSVIMEWEVWVERTKEGTGRLLIEFGPEGGKKQTCKQIISNGKTTGKNRTSPYEQACLEAASRWNKQMEQNGYALTVEESILSMGVAPMLAYCYEKHSKHIQWDSAFAQPRLGGFRCLARKAKKKVYLTSSENRSIPGMIHIAESLKFVLPEGTTLDGEIYLHGLSINEISAACRKKTVLSAQIEYHVYDVLSEESFESRYDFLNNIKLLCPDPKIILIQTVKVRSEHDLMVCQKEFLEAGYKGAMLRHGKTGYQVGKRTTNLLKVETFKNSMFVISDWKLARGRYSGAPIFTCTTEEGHDFDVLAPGTLKEKRALGTDASKFLGKKLLVKYQNFTKNEEPVPFLPVALKVED